MSLLDECRMRTRQRKVLRVWESVGDTIGVRHSYQNSGFDLSRPRVKGTKSRSDLCMVASTQGQVDVRPGLEAQARQSTDVMHVRHPSKSMDKQLLFL